MTESQAPRTWQDVDRTSDPRSLATYLDQISGLESFREYKRRALALLEPRPGARILEVGCGTGSDARAVAAMVAPGGLVVGVDFSETLLAEARAQNADVGVEYLRGDAHLLSFRDASFDGCRADRIFQHLVDPRAALAEMVRVARRSAPIVISEPDWETFVVDMDDRALHRALAAHDADALHQNGWIGRELPRLFGEAGLRDVRVIAEAIFTTDYGIAKDGAGLEKRAIAAASAGVISTADAERWLGHFARLRDRGQFWCSMLLFTVRGRKP